MCKNWFWIKLNQQKRVFVRQPILDAAMQTIKPSRRAPGEARPDIKIDFMPLARQVGHMIPSQHGFNIFTWLLRPKSRGEVRLRSADPFDRPAIEPRFFSAIEDAQAIVEGIRVARKLMKTEPFAPLVNGEVFPERTFPRMMPCSTMCTAIRVRIIIRWAVARWGLNRIEWPWLMLNCRFMTLKVFASPTRQLCPTSSAEIPMPRL